MTTRNVEFGVNIGFRNALHSAHCFMYTSFLCMIRESRERRSFSYDPRGYSPVHGVTWQKTTANRTGHDFREKAGPNMGFYDCDIIESLLYATLSCVIHTICGIKSLDKFFLFKLAHINEVGSNVLRENHLGKFDAIAKEAWRAYSRHERTLIGYPLTYRVFIRAF